MKTDLVAALCCRKASLLVAMLPTLDNAFNPSRIFTNFSWKTAMLVFLRPMHLTKDGYIWGIFSTYWQFAKEGDYISRLRLYCEFQGRHPDHYHVTDFSTRN